jgi:hypothetical protein
MPTIHNTRLLCLLLLGLLLVRAADHLLLALALFCGRRQRETQKNNDTLRTTDTDSLER